MYVDALLLFSNSQSITTGSENGINSSNSVDLGAAGKSLGTGEDLYVVVVCKTAMTSAGDTCSVKLITDDNDGLNSPAVIATLGQFPALSAIGAKVVAKLPPSNSYQRYIGLQYLAGGSGPLETGAFTAFLTNGAQLNKLYANGFSISGS